MKTVKIAYIEMDRYMGQDRGRTFVISNITNSEYMSLETASSMGGFRY